MTCIGCHGLLGWYDAEGGQWVSCLHCAASRAKYETDRRSMAEAEEACSRKLKDLADELKQRSHEG